MTKETATQLIEYCQSDGRICPLPDHWNQLWEMLPDKRRSGATWVPAPPLILAGWSSSAPLAKAVRLQEHIQWAYEGNELTRISDFLRSLPESAWLHIGD